MENPEAHIAVLPTPGMGHLIPAVEFVKRLYHHHQIASTIFIPTTTTHPLSAAQSSLLASLPSSIQTILLPAVELDDLSNDVKIETLVSLAIIRSLPSLRDAVKSLNQRRHLSAFVVDLFGTDAFEVAEELKIPNYVFYPSTAMVLSLMFHLPELDQTTSSEYWEVPEKFRIPGCIPIHGRDFVQPLLDRKNDAYKWFLHHSKRYKLAQGIVLNSFTAMERGPIEALQKVGNRRVFPIGPIIRIPSNSGSIPVLEWMNHQPTGSILYVSFGSGGALSHQQMIELALGLELSGQRFVWVIRCPHNTIPSASFFKIQNLEDPVAYLPEGFLDRTNGRGRVVPGWAPQVEILGHESVGGFMTHCGWNSTLESVVNGVPMIAWPLYAEQRMNAVMLGEEGLKVAVRLKIGEDGVVGRDEIGEAVRKLIEGEDGKEMRSRVRELKKAGAEAAVGESVKFMGEFVERLKMEVNGTGSPGSGGPGVEL